MSLLSVEVFRNVFARLKGMPVRGARLTPEGVGQDVEGGFREQAAVGADLQCGSGRPFKSAHETLRRSVPAAVQFVRCFQKVNHFARGHP